MRNLDCSSLRVSNAQMRAVVKDSGPGDKVVFPEEQAPRNSKDL